MDLTQVIPVPIDLQHMINSPMVVSLVSLLARVLPPVLGYPLCDLIADRIVRRRDSKVVQAIRLNQWVARGESLQKAALDRVVRETLRNNARTIYDLYHYNQNPKAIGQLICLNPAARALLERPEFDERGLVIAGLHLSNFDFVLQSASRRGWKGMVLTIPDPQGGRRIEYEMRKKTGMNLVPASVSTLRQAVKHLEKGGIVLTGLDRPMPDVKFYPKFFGRPACLPTHYAYIASKARVPVVIMATIQHADGKYHIINSEPIEIERDPEHMTESLRNAENVLRRAEDFIRLAPAQWNMPLPVWPELMERVPR